MTLSQVIKGFELIASKQPAISMIVQNDIFRLNSKEDARYGVFGWTQGQHSGSNDSDLYNFAFTFFYVDRLTEDRKNQIEVQSVGIEVLSNIIRTMEQRGLYVDLQYTFQPFNQRFIDECAGVFCNVTITVPISSACSEEFADFLATDFNDDFLIY